MESLAADMELSPVQKKMAKPKATPEMSRRLPPEVRKARHRDRMQRQRLAEKKSIEVKRVEVARLTRELEAAVKRLSGELQSKKLGDQGQGVEAFPSVEEEEEHYVSLERDGEEGWRGQSTAARIVQQRYLSLVLQQGTITEENRRLTERFRQWQRFTKLLGVEHERLPKEGAVEASEAEEALLQEGGGEGRWVVFAEDEPVLFYQPIARNTCLELAFMSYQKMQEVLRGPGARQLYNEAFGWKVYFSMHSEESELGARQVKMQHRFTKRISAIDVNGERITGDTLAKATWRIMNSPELYAQMYRNPMTSRMIQRVDSHTSVLLRTSPDENGEMRKRFVCLVVQVQDCVIDAAPELVDVNWHSSTRSRITIMSRILDPGKCFPRTDTHSVNPASEWMREGMTYLSFTEIDDENSVEIESGGLTNVGDDTASCTGLPFACMNMGEALVRWEQLVTPTRTLSINEKA